MNLRLPPKLLQAIDDSRNFRVGSVSRNTWILEAISEKLARKKQQTDADSERTGFYEFFAGGGMARAGLGPNINCLFANDLDPKKANSYSANWGGNEFNLCDVASLTIDDLPPGGHLAWASFPCQDLSLAGGGAGLKGKRSGTFWPFWELMKALRSDGRAPRLIVLENVCGALTSHNGKDFAEICQALSSSGYRFGAVIMDAIYFTPQSRPRLFIVALDKSADIIDHVRGVAPNPRWHTKQLINAYGKLSQNVKLSWVWWQLPEPPLRNFTFADILEKHPEGVKWHTHAQTKNLIDMMSDVNLAKVRKAQKSGKRIVGGIYKRTRLDVSGNKVQRAEVRFDNVAGCLRTPGGGSSRQTIIIIKEDSIRTRLLSPREAARLMGLPDDYILPERYNEAYHLIGDGLVVPVVRFLSENLLEPLLDKQVMAKKIAEVA